MIPKVLFKNDGKLNIEDIHMGMAKVGKDVDHKKMYAVLNKDGDFVSDYEYEVVRNYSEGYAVVGNNYQVYSRDNSGELIRPRYGLIDEQGNLVVPQIYEELGKCKDGLLPARKAGRWGYITPCNEVKVPFIYEEARSFSEGMAAVMLGSKYGFIDVEGKVVIKFNYIWVHDFADGVCFVQSECASMDDNISYIDKKGHEAVRVNSNLFGKYGMPSDYCNGVMVLDRTRCIDKEGNINFELEDRYQMQHFNDGLSCVFDVKTASYGFVDIKGDFVIPCKYANCEQPNSDLFPQGMIGVQNKDDKWGIIDYSGKEIVPIQYNKLHGYSNGRVLVSANDHVCSIKIAK